jgi:serine/threonine-protein kinase
MPLTAGTKVGPYTILAPLGAGGMGEVYRARDPRLSREVAIKVLPPAFALDTDRLRRFEQEARAAGMLDHPNVTAVHDIGQHDGAPYVVTELLEGATLRSDLAGGALPLRTAIGHALQIARGLAAAHAKGVVHRDLKPENLFVTADGRIKILDFGLAKLGPGSPRDAHASAAPTEQPATEPGVVMGTVGYMSPEQVRGQAVDHRSDIFAMGAVLYEMLTGRRAFRGETPADTLSAILREDPPAPDGGGRPVPGALKRVVARCLEKNPENRFQSARDVAFALEALSDSGETAATVGRKAPRRTQWILLGSAAVAAALLGVFLASRPPSGSAPAAVEPGRAAPAATGAASSIAVLPFVNLSRDADNEYFSDGMTEELIHALSAVDGLRVVSRTSVFAFKGKETDVREIGRQLDVQSVLEGSVRKEGGTLRVTAQLVDVSDGYHRWSQTFDRESSGVFAVQDEIARAIATTLRGSLGAAQPAPADRATLDMETYELYLKGRYFLNRATPEALAQARDYFRRAIERTPGYAKAHAGMADTYTFAIGWDPLVIQEALPKAIASARRAVEVQPGLAEAHAAMGFALHFQKDRRGAEEEYRRALTLDPNSSIAHDSYSYLLAGSGRLAEAIAEARRARQLDPLSPGILNRLGLWVWIARRHEEAAGLFRRALELDPRNFEAHWYLAGLFADMGRPPESRQHIASGRKIWPHDQAWRAAEIYTDVKAGQATRARRALADLEAEAPKDGYHFYRLAAIHGARKDNDAALSYLEKWIREYRDTDAYGIGLFEVAPWFDPLRADPRFQGLLARLRREATEPAAPGYVRTFKSR